ncbi:MAG: indole-3-glycerol-phosphate synthase [Gammaproteobacteria bacterium RBG_16_51_14]|nr:MAG: indole-3-glycerol-phosphate synthase [Gammaproteobacteria bacterium RBG_16_51_14]
MQKTPDLLKTILDHKAGEIRDRRAAIALADLRQQALDCPSGRGFTSAIRQTIHNHAPAIIAELKMASPSRGVIRKDFHPGQIAQSFADAGATCLSVLTDIRFFQGSDAFLQHARDACVLPVLRKDFLIDPYQVFESKVIGADAVLLIVAALSDLQLQELAGTAAELGLDVLVEVHDREELERGQMLRTPLIGINNRNLHTFEIDLDITLGLLPDVFPDRIVVTESGIHSRLELMRMRRLGVHAFLIGELFMQAADPGAKLKELIAE